MTARLSAGIRDPRTPNAVSNLSAQDINLPQDFSQMSFRENLSTQQSVNRRLFSSNINDDSRQGQAQNQDRTENMNNPSKNQDDSIFSRPFGEELPAAYHHQEKGDFEESKSFPQAVESDDQSVSYSANGYQYLYADNYAGLISGVTSRSNTSRRAQVQKFTEVMIHNIDKETTQFIINDLNKQDIKDLNFNLIRNNILIVKFETHEAAMWAFQQYDGKVVNGRKLKVSQFLQSTTVQRKLHQTQLYKINEMNDNDEDIDQEQPSDKQYTQVQQNQQLPIQNQHQQLSKSPQVRNVSKQLFTQLKHGSQGSQIHPNMGDTISKFQPNPLLQSTSPPPGFQTLQFQRDNPQTQAQHFGQGQPFNDSSQFHRQYTDYSQQQQMSNSMQFPPAQQLQQTYSETNFHTHTIPQAQTKMTLQSQSFNPSTFSHSHFKQAHNFQNPASRQTQLYPQQPLVPGYYVPQNQMNQSLEFIPQQNQRFSLPLPIPQHREQTNHEIPTQNLDLNKQQSFDPNTYHETAFGYSQSNSGLLLQQHHSGSQNKGSINENLHNWSKISSSIDVSQDDDQIFQNAQDQNSGSERGSLYHQTQVVNTRNVLVTGSTKNSDSNNSQNIHAQFKNTQHYQSPMSLQKIPMTQRYHDNSFELVRNTSTGGLNTPPSYLTPGSNKQLNNSFQFPQHSSQQSLNYFRQDFPIQHAHNRNLSHHQQLGELNLFGTQQHQFYMSQKINVNMHHSMSYVNFNHPPSNSSDMNDVSLYGMPLQPSYHHHMALSSLNSSFDVLNLSGHYKKKKPSREQKSHQTLKSTYSESSLLSQDSMMELDIEKIKKAEDHRTTVMVKNIPNKYDQKAILQEINENHLGKYDFLYLPIDFANHANVGYAFINFVHPLFILDFYKEFHKRRWTKYNSTKICDIKYGRIQGLELLKEHFRSSSVMNQTDESVRPRIFEQNNRKDWTQELKKIIEKYHIATPIEKFQARVVAGSNNQSLNSTSRYEPSQSIGEAQNEEDNNQLLENDKEVDSVDKPEY